jgi:hypothetical protein
VNNQPSQSITPRRSHAANAERDFLTTLVADDLAQARQVQQRIDTAYGQRLPVADVHEVTHDELTAHERDSLFGAFHAAFADTVAMELAS